MQQTSQTAVRVALVGAGAMGWEHLKALSSLPGVALAGVASRTRAKAEALAGELGIAVVVDSVAELHERSRADLVVVAVPELAARSVAEQCFAFPWAVFLEKPAGYDLADAEAIMSVAGGRPAWVGLNRRQLASSKAVLEDLRDDPAPRFIQIFDQQDLDVARALGHPETVSRNWMFANSIHLIDYAPLFGRGRIIGVDRILPWNPGKPGPVAACIRFDSGDTVLYQAVWNAPGPWACTVTTPRRRWELRPLESAAYQDAGQRRLVALEPDPLDQTWKPGFRRQAERLLDGVRTGHAEGLPTLADSLRTMRLIAVLYGMAELDPAGL